MPFVCRDQQPDSPQDLREGWSLLSLLPSLEVAHALFNFVLSSRDAQAALLFLKEKNVQNQTNKKLAIEHVPDTILVLNEL